MTIVKRTSAAAGSWSAGLASPDSHAAAGSAATPIATLEAREWSALRRTQLASMLERLALAHVLLPVAIALMAVVGFALSIRLGSWVLVCALLATTNTLRLAGDKWAATGRTMALVLAIHLLAGLIAALIPDASWDGLSYQQEGVLRLAAGWNPLFQDAGPFGIGDPIFNNHYPKLSWIAAAVVLLTTGAIEAGKLFNLTLLVAAGAQVGAALLRLTSMPVPFVVIVAGLVALNPIAITQAETFYIDGALGSALTVMLAGLVTFAVTRRRSALAVAMVAAALAANLKFTGLAYVVVLVGLAVPFTAYWSGRRAAVTLSAAAMVTGCVAVLVIGYAPYVRNLVEQRDVFYSAPRSDVAGVRPVNLNGMNRFERFLSSNLSPSSSTRAPESTHLKWPFVVGRHEARALYSADLEIGGFGPLYGAALLLAVVGSIVLFASPPVRRAGTAVSLIAIALLASMFVHGETWWARYVPQAWLLPILIATAGIASPPRSALRRIAVAIVVVLTLNLSIVSANVAWDDVRYVRANRMAMQQITAAQQPVAVYFAVFPSLRQRLREAGVEFRAVDTPLPPPARRHELPAPGHRAAWFD